MSILTSSAKYRFWASCFILMIALCLALAGSGVASASASDFAAIDTYIEAQMNALRIPGLALAVVHGDQAVYLKGYGSADPSGRPVTAQTPFMLASLAKPMTGLAAMQLVEAGKIDLDAPVTRYLPWFRTADVQASAEITVRDLLYQTSGLSEQSGMEYAGVEDLRPDALEQRVRALQSVGLVHPVGTTYEYSNANYQILGLIIEQVSGQLYETYMRQHVFSPLGISQTYTSETEAQQHGLATGYRYWFGLPFPDTTPFDRGGLPSGFIIASVEDVARFVVPFLNGGRLGDTAILSPQGIAAMIQPAGRKPNSDESYAMDWGAINVDGRQWVIKGGDLADFKTQIVLVPGEHWGVVTLINTNNSLGSALGDLRLPLIPLGVTKLLLGQQPDAVPASSLPLVLTIIPWAIAVLQLAWAIRSEFILRRWRSQPGQLPKGTSSILLHIGLPLILNLAVSLIASVGVPGLVGFPLSYLIYEAPDFGYGVVAVNVVGIGWIVRWIIGNVVLRRASQTVSARVKTAVVA